MNAFLLFASEAHEPNSLVLPSDINEVIWGTIGFLTVFTLIVWKGGPAIKNMWNARIERIRSEIETAEATRSEAEAKLAKNYPIEAGNGRRKPDINAVRMVAKYTGSQPVSFTAPWGSPMTLKPGDYLVQEPGTQDQFYRVARYEYEQTYNPPGE